MFKKLTLFLIAIVFLASLINCDSSTSTTKKTTVTFKNVYWNDAVDGDSDGYKSKAKLNFETEASKNDIDVFVKVKARLASGQDTASYDVYMTSGNYVTGTSDAKYVDIGSPNLELLHYCYDFLIQIFETNDPEKVLAEANISSFSVMKAVCFETQEEDALPQMNVSTTSLSFGTTYATRTFDIINAGGGVLNWTISTNQSWLSVNPNSGTTLSGNSTTIPVAVDRSGLSAGNYNGQITITPSHGSNAIINVSMTVESYGLTLTFTNPVFTDLEVSISGYGSKIASPGGNVVFTFATNPGAISLSAETKGQTTGGTRIGELIVWDVYLDVSSYTEHTYNMNVGSNIFFIYITNTGYALSPMYVNYGRAEQTMDNIVIPADGIRYRTGYFRAFTNTKVWMPFQGYGTGILKEQGTDFTLPWTVNQKAELTNSLSPGSPGLIEYPDLPEVTGNAYTLIPEIQSFSKKVTFDGEDLFHTN